MSSSFLIIFYNKIYKALTSLSKNNYKPTIFNFDYSNIGLMTSKPSEIEILSIV